MKVLMLGGPNSRNAGGIFNILYTLGHGLHIKPSIDINFLLYDDEYSNVDRSNYSDMSLHSYNIKGPSNFGYSKDISSKLARIKPDIIHAQGIWMYFSYVNKKFYLKTRTPYVISIQGMLDPWQLNQSFAKNLKKRIALRLYEASNLRNAACIIALCQSEYESIRAFGLKNPVAIIPNGIDLPLITHRTAEYHSASRWINVSNRKTLLFLSRIHPKKGLDILLKGWALTHPNQHSWQLVIAGETKDTGYLQSLLKQMRNLGIEDTVQFIGGQFGENKATCFIDADAFILPSYSEGLPVAVLEALSYKLPVLMTSYCNIPAAFTAHAAIAIDPSPESIAKGIAQLSHLSVEIRSQLGQNGYNLVKEHFTWDKIATDMHNLYKWILREEPQPNFVLHD